MGLEIQHKTHEKWRFGAVKCHQLTWAACACVCMHVCVYVCTYEFVHACVCVRVRMCLCEVLACMRDHQTPKNKRG